MNYEFPKIVHIDDVLPAIEGRDEFIVAERDGFKIINYNVGYPDTFDIRYTRDDTMKNHGEVVSKGAMRRECRGLIFDAEGWLISRPFHKFFNVGEREETQIKNVDLTQPHVIMEKMDGSMIRPLYFFDERDVEVIHLATKMGMTDTAREAEEFLNSLPMGERFARYQFMIRVCRKNMTPLFEFVSPKNRIVVEYEQTDLVLLGIRENVSGRYLSMKEVRAMARDSGFTIVPMYGSVDGSLDEYVERQRGLEGREGDVIRFADGHMIKIKNDQYVRIHKVKDRIRTDRHILALLLENDLDDVMPHLDGADREYVERYEREFHEAYSNTLIFMTHFADEAIKQAGGDRKRLATEVLPNSALEKQNWRFVFGAADGKDMNEMLMQYVRGRLGNTAKYNELAKFLGLEMAQEETQE